MFCVAPVDFFGEVGAGAADLIKDLADRYSTDRELFLQKLWTRVWNGTREARPDAIAVGDMLTYAMNHPSGKLADVALIRLLKYGPQLGAGLPREVMPYFDVIGTDPDGHLGRVILVRRLYHLFAIDPVWVGQQLIVRLGTEPFEEANDLWSAYSWSATVSPNLLYAFKESFLNVLCNRRGGGRNRRKLVDLFMVICMEAPNDLAKDEIRCVLESVSEDDLKIVLSHLKRRLRSEPANLADVWRNKIYPWLDRHWPRSGEHNTAGTTEIMLGVLVNCGDAFGHAVNWSIDYLRPLTGPGLHHLLYSEYPGRLPHIVLSLIDRIVDVDRLPASQKSTLRKLLDVLYEADVGIRSDARFHRLYTFSTQ